jgi:hypothetical protein
MRNGLHVGLCVRCFRLSQVDHVLVKTPTFQNYIFNAPSGVFIASLCGHLRKEGGFFAIIAITGNLLRPFLVSVLVAGVIDGFYSLQRFQVVCFVPSRQSIHFALQFPE